MTTAQERLQQILSRPEDRAYYALKNYSQWTVDAGTGKCLNRFSEFMDEIEYNVEPYELY